MLHLQPYCQVVPAGLVNEGKSGKALLQSIWSATLISRWAVPFTTIRRSAEENTGRLTLLSTMFASDAITLIFSGNAVATLVKLIASGVAGILGLP